MQIRPYRPEDKDKLIAIQHKQLLGWFGKEPTKEQLMELSSPLHIQTLVLEDDDGTIIAAMGAKATVEIMMTADYGANLNLRVVIDDLIKMWARLIVGLHQKGYVEAVAWVGPNIKKWSNTLVRRGGFKRLKTDSFWFNIEKEFHDAR